MREAYRFREPWGRSFQKKNASIKRCTGAWEKEKIRFSSLRGKETRRGNGGREEGGQFAATFESERGGRKVGESCRNEIALDNLCPSPRFSEISLSILIYMRTDSSRFSFRRQFLTIPRWRSDCERRNIDA